MHGSVEGVLRGTQLVAMAVQEILSKLRHRNQMKVSLSFFVCDCRLDACVSVCCVDGSGRVLGGTGASGDGEAREIVKITTPKPPIVSILWMFVNRFVDFFFFIFLFFAMEDFRLLLSLSSSIFVMSACQLSLIFIALSLLV